MSRDMLGLLIETTWATSAALLLVLLLRIPVRRWLGANAAYALWLCVPVATAAVLLPARSAQLQWVLAMPKAIPVGVEQGVALPASALDGWGLLLVWLAGAIAMVARQWWLQRRFVNAMGRLTVRPDGLLLAQSSSGLPAVVGTLQPRIVLPVDFEQRYTAAERELILHHERTHVARGDLLANLLAVMLRCVHWFNPLVHYALRRYRMDQELACDEWVIARHPNARRTYGQAMLKTQLDDLPLPVGCHWPAQHPLKERIAMIKKPSPTRKHWIAAVLLAGVATTATGYGAWAAQPAQSATEKHDFHYRAAMALDVDGNASNFEVREQSGKTFGVASSAGRSPEWRAEFTLDPVGAEQVRISGVITVDGKPVSRPVLVAELGKQAGMQITSPSGDSTLGLAMTVSRQPGSVPSVKAKENPVGYETLTPPRYPANSTNRGRVIIKIQVGTDGRVLQAELERSSGFDDLDHAAMAAAREWRFTPAMEDDKPVVSWVRVPVDFEPDTAVQEDIPLASHGDDAGRGAIRIHTQ